MVLVYSVPLGPGAMPCPDGREVVEQFTFLETQRTQMRKLSGDLKISTAFMRPHCICHGIF